VGGGGNGEVNVRMADGAQIRNIREMREVVFSAAPISRPPLRWDLAGVIIECSDATFIELAGGTQPICFFTGLTGQFHTLFALDSGFINSGNPSQVVASLDAGITLLLALAQQYFPPTTFDGTIGGPASAVIQAQFDATMPPTLSLPSFAGTLTITQTELAKGVGYAPGTPGNWASSAPTNVQSALDRMAALLKTLNGGTPIP
jgi:hypothetical protein